MDKLIYRKSDLDHVQELIQHFQATAILGARQCGKTTLARQIPFDHYFDLENPRDLARLDHVQTTLEDLRGLVVIDEIQQRPDLFPLLRVLIDQSVDRRFLILGSASRDLIRQSSESLAGRIAYYPLGGLRLSDLDSDRLNRLWLQGGLPRAYLAESTREAHLWLSQYITTFLERDIPQLGITIPSQTLRRFWLMLSHYHGQILNTSEIAGSFGVSDHTVRHYIDILAGTFMIRLVQPWFVNVGKRVVKRPKLYLRDSGLFHNLQFIDSREALLSHPKLGASWEGFALEQVIQAVGLREEQIFFWRTHGGHELDLFWQAHGKNWAVEVKYADAPRLDRSLQTAMKDLDVSRLWIVYPGKEPYSLAGNATVLPLAHVRDPWLYP